MPDTTTREATNRSEPAPEKQIADKPAAAEPIEASTPRSVAAAKPANPVTAAQSPAKPKATAAPLETVKAKRGRPIGSKTRIIATVAKPAAATRGIVKSKAIPKTVSKPVAPVEVATPLQGSRTMNDTITKMQDTAKKFTGEAGARGQAMFGDMSTQAKGAYEKSMKMTEELTQFHKGNVEAMVESSKLAAKGAETLGQEAADYARKSFETSSAAFKTFAAAKSPTELFKLQSDYAKSSFDAMVAESSKVTETWLKLVGEIVQPLSNRAAVAVDKVKATAAF